MSKIQSDFRYLLLPSDTKLVAAFGRVALAHAHLDHVIRMTLKTLTGVSMQEAWDA
jgi:hypothetical protein